MGYDRDDFSQSREINIKLLPWRQRMVEMERKRIEGLEKAKKADPTAFLKSSTFKIDRRG